MAERTAVSVLERRLPNRSVSPLAKNIKSALDTLGEISINLEALKNGNTEFNDVLDASILGAKEVRSRVLGRVPQVLWTKTDEVDSLHLDVPENVHIELKSEKHASRRKFRDTKGLISVSQIADAFAIPRASVHKALRTLDILTIIAGAQHSQHIPVSELLLVREHLINEKKRDGRVIQQEDTIPNGSLPVWKVRENLGIGPVTYRRIVIENGIEKTRIGGKYFLGEEEQRLLKKLVEQRKAEMLQSTSVKDDMPPDDAMRVSVVLTNLGVYSRFFPEIAKELEI